MSRKTVIPQGLITQPNKHGVYALGAMSVCLNMCMRDPGVLSTLPGLRIYRSNVLGSSYTARKIHADDASLLVVGDNSGTWGVRWVTGAASNTVTGPITTTFSEGKAQVAVMRDRRILTNDTAEPWVMDSEGDTSARRAGIAPPELTIEYLVNTDAQAVAPNMAVAYRAILVRKHSDGYETISAPSQRIIADNNTATTYNIEVVVHLPPEGVIAGDIVELYRTYEVATGSDPGDQMYLAKSYTLDSSDVSALQATVRDNATQDSLTAELYSNGDIESTAKYAPPVASDVAVFKGHTFYAAPRLRSSIALKVAGPTGQLSTSTERTTGIGSRSASGDITSGSADITSVSDTTGLVIGQRLQIFLAPGNTMDGALITGISGTTVTMSETANSSITNAQIYFSDVLEVNGELIDMSGVVVSINTTPRPNENYSAAGAALLFSGEPITYTFTAASLFTVAWPATFRIQNALAGSSDITIRATNGANYFPELPEIDESTTDGTSDPRDNRIVWSLDQQPEAVPPSNYTFVGAVIHRMIATRDALFIFCSDGLYRLSGDAGEWRVDPVDPNLILASREAVGTLGETIYAYTNRGLVAVSDVGGIEELSRGVVGDSIPGAAFGDTWDTFIACDDLHREVWLTLRSGSASTSYVYNAFTRTFVTVSDGEWSSMAYSKALRSLVIGIVSSDPDIYYFEDDTSATRLGGVDVRFQPFTGSDPNSLAEFIDVDYLFQGVTTAMGFTPRFSGTNYTECNIPAADANGESHLVVPVPRNAPAMARTLSPGLSIPAEDSAGITQLWSLRAISVRYENVSEVADR